MKQIKCISLLLFLLFFSINTNLACSCFLPPPPCYAFGKSEAVFVGKVTELTKQEDEYNFDKIDIEVLQNFRGATNKTFLSQSSHYDSACQSSFRKGETYLFYGNLSEDGKSYYDLGICWRTQIYNKSLADLAFLNMLDESKPIYLIWGTFSKGLSNTPVKGVKAEIIDNKNKKIVFSNNDGIIKLSVSKAGKYSVRVTLPSNASPLISDWESELKVLKNIRTKKRTEIIDYIVEVKPNQCGWFDVPMYLNR